MICNKNFNTMNTNELSRRSFIRKSVTLSAAASLMPTILSSEVIAVRPAFHKTMAGANERVNLACCAIGNRGAEIMEELYKTGLCNIVALCDVDMGAPQTLKMMEKFPEAKRFQDFRDMFDKMGNQIDAVSIAVPDHSHFPITVAAMQLGKHVFVEKPLGRTFYENELLIKAAKKYPKVVTQMGNQGHSEGNYFQFKVFRL